MQEGFVPISIFDKLVINVTSCYKVEEETNEEDNRQKNCPREANKTLAGLQTIPMLLNWGQIFSLLDKVRHHMVVVLQHPKLFVDKIKST